MQSFWSKPRIRRTRKPAASSRLESTLNENQVPSAPVEPTRAARRFPPVFRNRRFPSIATSRKNRKNIRRETNRADDVRSITAFAERFDQTFFFARSDRIRAAEVADAFAGHAPSQVARTAVTVFDFSVGGNAKTLGHAFVSLHFRHLEALSSRYKFAVGVGKRDETAERRVNVRSRQSAFFRRLPERRLAEGSVLLPAARRFSTSRAQETFSVPRNPG